MLYWTACPPLVTFLVSLVEASLRASTPDVNAVVAQVDGHYQIMLLFNIPDEFFLPDMAPFALTYEPMATAR